MNSEERLLYIVDRLLDQEVSNASLATEIFGENNANNRTKVRNSIAVIKKTFGEKCVETAKGKHKLIDIPQVMRELYKNSAKGMIEVFEFISLFDSKKFDIFKQSEPELVTRIKKETDEIYSIFDKPFEEITNQELWHEIKSVVKNRRYISVVYKKNELKTYNHIKPIRIVYAHNNWYLAVLLDDEEKNYDFTPLRINNIIHLEKDEGKFHNEPEAIAHLNNMQSLFEGYKMPRQEVQVEVSKKIAVYFRHKKYLKTQKIIDERKDGSLLLSYEISTSKEIFPLIKQWIPHIRIVHPLPLKEEIEKIFRDYIQ
jgi:hypothetical protein